MKLAIRPFALTFGALWSVAALFCGLMNMWFPPYADSFLQLLGSIYPGYTPDGSFGSAVSVTLYAFVDGVIGGCLFAWLYNTLVRRSKDKGKK